MGYRVEFRIYVGCFEQARDAQEFRKYLLEWGLKNIGPWSDWGRKAKPRARVVKKGGLYFVEFASSAWKDFKGDEIRELFNSCTDLKFLLHIWCDEDNFMESIHFIHKGEWQQVFNADFESIDYIHIGDFDPLGLLAAKSYLKCVPEQEQVVGEDDIPF